MADAEIGSTLENHLASSTVMASRLQQAAARWVQRIATENRTVGEVAADVIELTGWHHDPAVP